MEIFCLRPFPSVQFTAAAQAETQQTLLWKDEACAQCRKSLLLAGEERGPSPELYPAKAWSQCAHISAVICS